MVNLSDCGRPSTSRSGMGKSGGLGKCPNSGEFMKNGKKYIRLIGRDCVRDVLIPNQEPNIQSILFCRDEFSKFGKELEVTPLDKETLTKAANEEKAKRVQESVLRKKQLESFPVDKNYGPVLSLMEEEARKKANHLLERVRDVKREQSDEIKTCNTYILGKKCQAIRDAQIAEKKVLEKELAEEEKRLEKVMEEERSVKEWEEDMKKKWEAERKAAFREALLQQIRDNELQREILAERIEEEQRLMNEAAMRVQLDCLDEQRRRKKEQEKIKEEMNRINSEIIRLVEQERRESKLAELRVQECIRVKEEEEARRVEERLRRKKEKARDLAKVMDEQQKILDKKSERDEKEAKRIQDEIERKWRAKEKESKEERRRKWEELKRERNNQREERKRAEAVELEEEKREKQRAVETERAIREAEERMKEEKRKVLLKYREELLKQINEKEKERIKEKKQFYEDGFLLEMEEKFRKEDLKEAMAKKISEIRTHNIPESYIQEVERKLKMK